MGLQMGNHSWGDLSVVSCKSHTLVHGMHACFVEDQPDEEQQSVVSSQTAQNHLGKARAKTPLVQLLEQILHWGLAPFPRVLPVFEAGD